MIVEFSVKNFRSINELQTISFVASGLKSSEQNSIIDTNNISKIKDIALFKTLGIYGANASGKSNIIKALDYFIRTIYSQPTSVSNLSSLCQPFLFQKDSESTESYFQIVIIIKETKYRYGLTVKKNLNEKNNSQESSSEIITNEWLYADKAKNMTPLFIRTGSKIGKINLQNKNKIPQSLPFKHTLFLTHASAFDTNGDCFIITDYLRRLATSNFDLNHDKFRWLSINHLDNDLIHKNKFINLLSTFNLKYDDIILDKESENNKDVFPQEKVTLSKQFKHNNESIYINLNLRNNESSGTQKMFDLAGLLLRAFSLREPAFIILDEIDSNFHPALLIKLVDLFNNPNINKSSSQLLFTSHDTNLMSPSIMRRDQFYFTEKLENNSTRLYSLSDLKGIRNDADFAKQYLAGYYGALPYLDNFYSLDTVTE
jgi:AAA15 family ATPase/GTPase